MDVFKEVIRRLRPRTRRLFWYALALSLVASILSVLANVLFGVLAERFVGIEKGNASSAIPAARVLAAIFALYLTTAVVGFFSERFTDRFQIKSLNELRIIGYEKLQRLPIEYYVNSRPGTVVQRTTYVSQLINWLRDLSDGRIYAIAIPLFSMVPLFFFS